MKSSTFNMAIHTQIYSQYFGFATRTPPELMDVLGNIPAVDPSPSTTKIPPQPSMPFAPAAELEKQITQFDRLICLQNERLRLNVQKKRKQEMGLMMRHYESKIQFLLKQKEAEICEALNKNTELEALLRGAEMEKEGWKRAAMEKEAAAASLETAIRQLQGGEKGAAAAESWCDDGERERRMTAAAAVCRSCNSEKCSVVFMPCRHLGSCKSCEGFLDWCPLCWTVKRTTIQALL